MGNQRGRGKTGMEGNATVKILREDGSSTPAVANNEGQMKVQIYSETPSESLISLKTDEEGNLKISGDQNVENIRSSDGYISLGTTFSDMNGGSSLSIPDGTNLCIKAHRENNGQIEIRDKVNQEKIVLLSGEKYLGNIKDVSLLEWRTTTDGDQAEWFFER